MMSHEDGGRGEQGVTEGKKCGGGIHGSRFFAFNINERAYVTQLLQCHVRNKPHLHTSRSTIIFNICFNCGSKTACYVLLAC